MKRFYKQAFVSPSPSPLSDDATMPRGGHQVMLDGRELKTAAKRALLAPTQRLAEAIAAEWNAQPEDIDPATMPMTGYIFTALDVVADKVEQVRDEVARYAETDLLCYMSDEPKALGSRLRQGWQPWLDWSAKRLDAPLTTTAGVMAVRQPEASIAIYRQRIKALDVYALTAMQTLVSVLGSLVLATTVQEGALSADEAFDLARLEEVFQIEQWGADEEASAKMRADRMDVSNAARFLQITRIIG